MARILSYNELKQPGFGYLEMLDCEYREYQEALAVPCVWLDQDGIMTDNSYYCHVDEDEPKYSVSERSKSDYNNIARDTIMAWRIWDSKPTDEEMFSHPWNVSHALVQPTLYYRGD